MGSDPEKGGQGRTACTPGPGCSEAGEACGADEVYGLYAGAIRDGVANCADYLDRIIRQLEGVPSRHYVTEKAQLLRAAAGGLVGVCHDVEIWLRYCGKPVPFGDSGGERDEEEELVCTACEFEADSIEALAEHVRERGH